MSLPILHIVASQGTYVSVSEALRHMGVGGGPSALDRIDASLKQVSGD